MEKRVGSGDQPVRRFASASWLELDTNCFDEVYLDQVTDLQRLELALIFRVLHIESHSRAIGSHERDPIVGEIDRGDL